MIPPTSSIFFGPIQDRCDPAHQETVALAKYLNRAWVVATLDDPYNYAVNLLTVIQPFGSALLALNPNPTVGEAVACVRAYNPSSRWSGGKLNVTKRTRSNVFRAASVHYGREITALTKSFNRCTTPVRSHRVTGRSGNPTTLARQIPHLPAPVAAPGAVGYF